MRSLAAVLFVGAMLAVCSLTSAQPPGGGKGGKGGDGKGGKGGDKGGFPGAKGGGFGGGFGAGPAIGQIMPTFVQDQLKLTDAQKKDLEAMQKDIDAKLEKMLTEDQRKQLKELKERGRGPGGFGGGFGGPGGFPGGGGGPGGKGGPPKKDPE